MAAPTNFFGNTLPMRSPEEVQLERRRALMAEEQAMLNNMPAPGGRTATQTGIHGQRRDAAQGRVESAMQVETAEDRQAKFYQKYRANMNNVTKSKHWEGLDQQDRELEGLRVAADTAQTSGMHQQALQLRGQYNDLLLSREKANSQQEQLEANVQRDQNQAVTTGQRKMTELNPQTGNKEEFYVDLDNKEVSPRRVTEYGKFDNITLPDGTHGLVTPTGEIMEQKFDSKKAVMEALDRTVKRDTEFAIIDGELNQLDKAIELADNWWTTGRVGKTMAAIGGLGAVNEATDLNALITSLESNLAFDRLQKMRDLSPTGGALGQVSVIELDLLKSALASLRQSQSSGQLTDSLQVVQHHYKNYRSILRMEHAAKDINYLDPRYSDHVVHENGQAYLINRETGARIAKIQK